MLVLSLATVVDSFSWSLAPSFEWVVAMESQLFGQDEDPAHVAWISGMAVNSSTTPADNLSNPLGTGMPFLDFSDVYAHSDMISGSQQQFVDVFEPSAPREFEHESQTL